MKQLTNTENLWVIELIYPEACEQYALCSSCCTVAQASGAVDKFEKCACVHLMWFNKAKCKILGLGSHQYQYRLEDEGIEQSCRVRLGDADGWKVGHEPAISVHSSTASWVALEVRPSGSREGILPY